MLSVFFFLQDYPLLFRYTGSIESFTAPVSGKYKMECWGASGNTDLAWGVTNRQGNGGYCYIINYTTANSSIYICVGSSNLEINYNNRLSGISAQSAASGGGATSITLTNRGELLYFSSYKNEVILVAGAGGGCEWIGKGGAGGGTTGCSGSSTVTLGSNTCDSYGTGGTENSGGKTIVGSKYAATVSYNGSCGIGSCGASAIDSKIDSGAQGGSGWYGGGGSIYAGAAGGGSSYIKSGLTGNTIAGDKVMPALNGGTQVGQIGDGASIVTQTSF